MIVSKNKRRVISEADELLLGCIMSYVETLPRPTKDGLDFMMFDYPCGRLEILIVKNYGFTIFLN